MTEIQSIVIAAVTQYRNSVAGFAMVKVGKYIEVRVDQTTEGGPVLVEVSWPSLGACNAAKTAEFAADLTKAAHVVSGIEGQMAVFKL
jgi:hypothetical protein